MTAMRLYILGPAFGLPSIDAECTSAVALLQLYARKKYEIIVTHEQSQPLPHLIDGTARISGFSSIARHLIDKGIADQDVRMSAEQRADRVAITSLIESNAPTLLDISLYVGFENYRLRTRPAYTKILPWHANYIIPPQRRSAARMRTERLGISSIDVDNVHEDMSNRPPGFDGVGKDPQQGFAPEIQQRASLLLPRKETLRSLLQRPENAAVFKLHALAENLFEPLQAVLGGKEYFLGDEVTAVDCLVYGYLSLMLYPALPQDWLASTMKRKYKKLVAYVQRIHQNIGLATNVDDVIGMAQCDSGDAVLEQRAKRQMTLPWSIPHASTASQTLISIWDGIWNQLPILGNANKLQLWHAQRRPYFQRNLKAFLLSVTGSVAAAGYLSVYSGLLVWPRGEEMHVFGRRRLSDFGHLGAALAGISFIGPQAGGG